MSEDTGAAIGGLIVMVLAGLAFWYFMASCSPVMGVLACVVAWR